MQYIVFAKEFWLPIALLPLCCYYTIQSLLVIRAIMRRAFKYPAMIAALQILKPLSLALVTGVVAVSVIVWSRANPGELVAIVACATILYLAGFAIRRRFSAPSED